MDKEYVMSALEARMAKFVGDTTEILSEYHTKIEEQRIRIDQLEKGMELALLTESDETAASLTQRIEVLEAQNAELHERVELLESVTCTHDSRVQCENGLYTCPDCNEYPLGPLPEKKQRCSASLESHRWIKSQYKGHMQYHRQQCGITLDEHDAQDTKPTQNLDTDYTEIADIYVPSDDRAYTLGFDKADDTVTIVAYNGNNANNFDEMDEVLHLSPEAMNHHCRSWLEYIGENVPQPPAPKTVGIVSQYVRAAIEYCLEFSSLSDFLELKGICLSEDEEDDLKNYLYELSKSFEEPAKPEPVKPDYADTMKRMYDALEKTYPFVGYLFKGLLEEIRPVLVEAGLLEPEPPDAPEFDTPDEPKGYIRLEETFSKKITLKCTNCGVVSVLYPGHSILSRGFYCPECPCAAIISIPDEDVQR
jgi:hypothetical protein